MTGLTYKTQAEKDADRDRQRELLKALSASDLALRLDECGAWRINGRSGHIFTDADGGWVMSVICSTARTWTSVKNRLAFCEVTQDGDDEGCLRLRELPTAERAATVRSIVGIPKRRPAPPHAFRGKELKPHTEGVKPAPEPRNASGGYQAPGEASHHDFGASVSGLEECAA